MEATPGGRFEIGSRFFDEDHDADLTLTLDVASGTVLSARARFHRAPYGERCAATAARAGRLVGLRVRPGCSRDVAEAVGGPEGCTHLVEMVMDALRAYLPAYGRGEMLRVAAECRAAGRSEDEAKETSLAHIYRLGLKVLPDTCVIYRRGAGAAEGGAAARPAGAGSGKTAAPAPKEDRE